MAEEIRSSLIDSMTKEELLCRLLNKECAYYRVIMELSRNERERLEKKAPFTEITKLLRKKKIILACIEEVEIAITPLKRYWDEKKNNGDSTASQVNQLFKTLGQLVKDIITLDEGNQKLMQVYLDEMKEKILRESLAKEPDTKSKR